MGYDWLIFDLDGTISDPIQGLCKSVNYSLQKHGYPEISKEAVAELIGPPLHKTFKVMANTSDEAEIDKLIASYRERFGEFGYKENILYPDIAETLRTLSSHTNLGLCTSKISRFAEKILDHFEIREFFQFVSGGEDVKHKGQQLEKLLTDKTISTNSIMIGDRNVDLIAGRTNGLDTAGVLWGYGSKDELQTEDPQYIFKNVTDLLKLKI